MELRKLLKNIGKIIIDLENYLNFKLMVSWGKEVSDLNGYIKAKQNKKHLYKGMMQSA